MNLASLPWSLWRTQTVAVTRLELRRILSFRRVWWILAAAPVVLTGLHSLAAAGGKWPCSLGMDTRAYAGIFQLFILRFGIFFGCVGIFTTLFRGEVIEKTMHYYFLTPVRREILALGKYIAGEITAMIAFVGGSALAYVLITLHFGAAHWQRLLRGPGLYELGWYVLVSALACLGYGAIFLAFGLWFKNPMIPAIALLIWEGLNPFLPAVFKNLSVIFYLQGLCPVEVSAEGPSALFAILSEPPPVWVSIPSVVLLAAAMLVLAGLTVRKMEVNYGE